MATPYITPAMLQAAPAGLSWQVVPALTASGPEQAAQLQQVCWQATSIIDGYCRQPLRATAVTEQGCGPGQARVSVDRNTRRGTLITRQGPVTAVNAVQVSQSRSFPPAWTLVPADRYRIRHPVLMPASGVPVTGWSGGYAVDVAPGVITWDYGRGGWDVLNSYTSGWPHAGLTSAAASGDGTIGVDDVTGWAGWTGFVYDSTVTELVTVTGAVADSPVQLPGAAGTVQAGPGTLTLSGPLANAHAAGTVISALPGAVLQAAALRAAVMALETIAAIAVQASTGNLPGGLGALATESELALDSFRRIA